jgi:hypothetical protein
VIYPRWSRLPPHTVIARPPLRDTSWRNSLVRIRLFAFAAIISCAVTSGAHAQTQQQVAFIGDGLTWEWQQTPQFKSHKNWIGDGSEVRVGPNSGGVGTDAVLTQLRTIIATGKKPIIHLMVGESNSELPSENFDHAAVMAGFGAGFDEIIVTAQQAKLQIIVGTIPYSLLGDVSDLNKWIFLYCAAHKVPVVNYANALSGAGFAASGHAGGTTYNPNPNPYPVAPVYWAGTVEIPSSFPYETLTPQGWDLVSDMAQAAIIQVEGYKLKGGYLQTVGWNGGATSTSTANANFVNTGGTVQFTPYGQFSDGSTHIMNNADIYGHLGTWTSTVSETVWIDPYGVGTGLNLGTANVRFTTPTGMTFNAWRMTVGLDVYGCSQCEGPW